MHDSVSSSRSLASLSDAGERLFWRILAQTDASGRMRGEPVKVRASCAPMLEWTDALVAELLTELQVACRIQVYGENGDLYLQVIDFERWQTRPLRNRGVSRFPDPPEWTTSGPLVVTSVTDRTRQEKKNVNGQEASPLVAEKPATDTGQVRLIYEHWRSERGKVSNRYVKISEARKRKIQTRLREFSVDELLLAITNVANDPWPDRPSHDDLTVIFRSREQVERFLEMPALSANGTPAAETPEQFRARIAAIDARWKEQPHG